MCYHIISSEVQLPATRIAVRMYVCLELWTLNFLPLCNHLILVMWSDTCKKWMDRWRSFSIFPRRRVSATSSGGWSEPFNWPMAGMGSYPRLGMLCSAVSFKKVWGIALWRALPFLVQLTIKVCVLLPRMNWRTLKTALSTHAARFGMQWDQYLSGVLWAYRNTPHESTEEKRSFLLFGTDCRSPTEAALLPQTLLEPKEVEISERRLSSLWHQPGS